MKDTTRIHGRELVRMQVQGKPKILVALRGDGSTRLFEGHPLVEDFNRAHGTSLKIVSPKVANAALSVGKTWESLPCEFLVDALIAFEKPGKRLGKRIVFSSNLKGEPDVVLPTGKWKGEKHVGLVALGLTSADFTIDENSIVSNISDDRLIVVPRFPPHCGLYMPHAETGIPHGDKVGQSSDAIHLSRSPNFSYVGIPVRGSHMMAQEEYQYLYADRQVRNTHGLVAEVPEADVVKIQALLALVAKP